jgi:ADP-ribosylglycohydrolase
MDPALDRARGALWGLALGDALGMPTQELRRDRAQRLLGDRPGLLPGPADNPVSAGLPAGRVTDDTDQAVIVGQLLVEGGGRVDPERFAARLLAWQDRMARTGALDLLGPSTARALVAVRAGADPRTTGRDGTTNGAAMRVAPVGVAVAAEAPDELLAAVRSAGLVTHDTPVARAGATAVAAVVSLGVDGVGFEAALPRALELATRAASQPPDPGRDANPGPDDAPDPGELAGLVHRGVRLARGAALDAGLDAALDAVAGSVGTGVQTREAVPAAFAVAALAPANAWAAAGLGARLGGDADTIAAMAGAMVGACTGLGALPPDGATALAEVRRVNDLPLDGLAAALLGLRRLPGLPHREGR